MRVAIAQIDMGFEEKEKAMAICSELMAEAKEKGVDFIVFPEMTLPGFTLNPETYGENRKDSKTMAFFREEAKKNGVAVCLVCPCMKTAFPPTIASFSMKTANSWRIMRRSILSPSAQRRNITSAAASYSSAK
ncbi:MAG: hypothetical protein IJY52_03345 [Anaerotignum sp.]|nr:hypothetical protein [Anaerotignum sp.]